MTEEIVTQLTALGLTRNEALAYLTLLEQGEAEGSTGYEVASRSGIPRSAVYTVLRKLELSGAAFSTGVKPARYMPTDPNRLIEQMRSSTNARLDRVSESLAALPKRAQPEPIWILSRYDEVMTRIDAMLCTARESIFLSLWPRELEKLMPTLNAMADKPLHRVLHSPDRLSVHPPGFSCWEGELGDEGKALWSHKALVIIDRKEALIGGTEPNAENHAVWTSNPSLVDVATNHIILDITLMSRALGRDCVDDVGPMMRTHLLPR